MNFFYPRLANQHISSIEPTNNSTYPRKRAGYFTYSLKPLLFLFTFLLSSVVIQAQAPPGPPASSITILPNGNYVVAIPGWDDGATQEVGIVYLYDGATDNIISTLKGSTANDQIGSGRVSVLSNGNFVISSPSWDNGTSTNAGAVTWGDPSTGVSGVVSATNSLVGTSASDQVGNDIIVLDNGNYIVISNFWDNGVATDAGAVTWADGTTGITGAISSSNSLVGTSVGDRIGGSGIDLLNNDDYAIRSNSWDDGTTANVGAITWANVNTSITGVVSASNSLIGSTAGDFVGNDEIIILSNGNYVVRNPFWDNGAATDAGAVTWVNGSTFITGTISSSNSLVGSSANDRIGREVIATLNNGNYVVCSPEWDNGAATDAGAATWADGTTGITGTISVTNSLVGTDTDNEVGLGVSVLTNDNYVVSSIRWDNGTIENVGALTWANGTTGIVGEVSITNSLIGTSKDDVVGGVIPLSNGNYVAASRRWRNGTIFSAGAVTWANGTTGIVGEVSPANSLVGSSTADFVGISIIALDNGNYLVDSYEWDNGNISNAGAVTWADGTTGIVGEVSAANSLVGNSNSSNSNRITVLTNGNYVVRNGNWTNGNIPSAGAVTWADGTTGIVGEISAANSLVGSSSADFVGDDIIALSNGNYVVYSPSWDNVNTGGGGAVTWADGTTGIVGEINATNSLVNAQSGTGAIGRSLRALSNGNYVIGSPNWRNGNVINAGAVTWVDGTTGITGTISTANSFVGRNQSDLLGIDGITELSNGNYVIRCSDCDNGNISNAGAVTWADGTTAITGEISTANSLFSTNVNDNLGDRFDGPIIELSNGNYLIRTPDWNGNKGALTWADGTAGITGEISVANSLIGSTPNDRVGAQGGVRTLSDGNYIVDAKGWDNGSLSGAGAVTYGDGTVGVTGEINSCNSVLGNLASRSFRIFFAYSEHDQDLIVVKDEEEEVAIIFNPDDVTESLATDGATTMSNACFGNTTGFYADDCQLIASVSPLNVSPLDGAVTASVWIDNVQDNNFVKRHYEITPAIGADTASAEVTLYFTQAEFDDFNAVADIDLPTSSADATGIANMRVEKVSGTSSDDSGDRNSYTGTTITIDPEDNDIVWNATDMRWEVSFDVMGFSGFFLKSAIPNDECTGAIPLTVNVPTAGNTDAATQSQPACATVNNDVGNADDDVWFTFTAANTEIATVTVTSTGANPIGDLVFELFSGNCGSLTPLRCQDFQTGNPESFAFNAVMGTQYFVRVYSFGTNRGTFEIEYASSSDECAGAVPLAEGVVTSGSTILATQSLPACTTTGGFTGTADDDVWYTFTASGTGKATITVESTGANPIGDLVFELFSGSCGSLTSLGCEDFEGTADPESNAFDVTMGEQYFVRVYSFAANSSGIFNIDYRIDPEPSNNECVNAIEITPANTSVNGTTNGATQSRSACTIISNSEDDVWYTFTSLADENATITVQASGTDPIDDIVFEIFTGDCNTLNSVACVNDNGSGLSESTSQAVTTNTQYFVRVYDFSNDGKTRGEFTITVNGTLLPVELTYFNAKATDCQTELTWQTASEQNNSHFEIEHSLDGKSFESIAKVVGVGTTLETQNYSYIHTISKGNEHYYRLKQVDLDGAHSYSPIQVVKTECEKSSELLAYPNPFGEGRSLRVESYSKDGKLQLFIKDITGKTVYEHEADGQIGINTIDINLDELPTGTYFLFNQIGEVLKVVKTE